MSKHLPLILDLDGTLLRTDTLVEAIVERLFSAPLQLFAALFSLLGGRAALKARLAEISRLDVEALPVREDLLAYAREQRDAGRPVYLVTAADQSFADAVAARFGVFTRAIGSDGKRNLKSKHKQAFLRETLPEGYVYAGDSSADLAVWKDADGIILAGASSSVKASAEKLGKPIEARFDNDKGSFKVWRKALRLHQWSKNLLVFAPLILAGLFTDTNAIIAAIIAFFGLSLAASGTYLLNDLADLSSDRRHRTKHSRPFASGRAGLGLGLVLAPALILAGLVLAIVGGSWAGGLTVLAYLAVTLAYSFGLKRLALVDVILLATLFTLRLGLGAAVINADLSVWLFSFSMFFFFSLSMAKRHVEIAAGAPGETIRGRGYNTDDAPFSLALGVASAMAAIMILCLYIIEGAFPTGMYRAPELLLAMPVLIAGWTMRIWLLAHRGVLDDDPVSFAVRDKVSIVMGGILVVIFAAAHFGAPTIG